MGSLKFNTNIKCDACVAKVAETLDELAGARNWEVNLQAPERTLTVSADVYKTAFCMFNEY